jgi:WD40 repeat protein
LFVDDDRFAILQANKLQIIDATNGSVVKSEEVATGLIWSIDSNRHALAIGSYRQTQFWEFAGRGFIGRLNHREPVTAICFYPQAKLVATGSLDGRVNLRDATNGRTVGDLQHQSQVVSMQFSPDGNFIATAQQDGLVRGGGKSDPVNRASIPNPARHGQTKSDRRRMVPGGATERGCDAGTIYWPTRVEVAATPT